MRIPAIRGPILLCSLELLILYTRVVVTEPKKAFIIFDH